MRPSLFPGRDVQNPYAVTHFVNSKSTYATRLLSYVGKQRHVQCVWHIHIYDIVAFSSSVVVANLEWKGVLYGPSPEPMQQPPAPLLELGEQSPISDFIVLLRRGRQLKRHFGWIGLDLSRIGNSFVQLDSINGYRVAIPTHIVRDLIIFDPNVDQVYQDAPLKLGYSYVDSTARPSKPLQKRQRVMRQMPWFVRMLTVGRPGLRIREGEAEGVRGHR